MGKNYLKKIGKINIMFEINVKRIHKYVVLKTVLISKVL